MSALIIILLCLLLNAVFAAVEMAFVTVRKAELRQRAKRGEKKAQRLLALRENPERALSVIQVSITLVGAVSAAVGGAGAEENLAPFFEKNWGLTPFWADALSIVAIVLPLTYFSVVVGELVPKTVALRRPHAVLAFGGAVLTLGSRVLGPIVSVLEKSTRFIVKLLPGHWKSLSPEEEASADIELAGMEQHQRQYLMNLAHLETRRVRDIYVPAAQMVWVDAAEGFGEVLKKVIASGHTRLPVLENNGIVGILHSKEFLVFVDPGNTDWQQIVRPALTVGMDDDVLGVLRRLQSSRQHMALVGANNRLLGMVTIEDILEEIVGEIYDEDDDGVVRRLLTQRHRARAESFGQRRP